MPKPKRETAIDNARVTAHANEMLEHRPGVSICQCHEQNKLLSYELRLRQADCTFVSTFVSPAPNRPTCSSGPRRLLRFYFHSSYV